MLIDEDNLDRALQCRTESVQRSVRIGRELIPSNDRLVPSLSVVDMSLDTESLSIVQNRLAEDGDSRFEWDNKGDCRAVVSKSRGRETRNALLVSTP